MDLNVNPDLDFFATPPWTSAARFTARAPVDAAAAAADDDDDDDDDAGVRRLPAAVAAAAAAAASTTVDVEVVFTAAL